MRVQVIGAENAGLAMLLAEKGVQVSLMVDDPHDRARLHNFFNRSTMALTPRLVPTGEADVDLVLGGCDAGGAGCVSLTWPQSGLSVSIEGLPGAPILLEQMGTDPSDQIVRLVEQIGAEHLVLPEGQAPVSARLSAALGITVERLMLLGASPVEVDEALVLAGWRIGPAEAQDIAGVDTVLALRKRVHRHLGLVDDLPLFGRAVAEGRLGRKVGVGWYRYPGNGGKVEDPLVEDMATEEARFANISQTFPDGAEIVEKVSAALREARLAMPHIPDADIQTAMRCAIGLAHVTRDRL